MGGCGVSIYQCEECGCAENTALGWYWYNEHKDPKYNKRKLCSACGPEFYSDGSSTEKCGKWHGRFKRKFYPIGSMVTDGHGNLITKEAAE
jgi:hypothetical protein